jgi:hypothetical protein
MDLKSIWLRRGPHRHYEFTGKEIGKQVTEWWGRLQLVCGYQTFFRFPFPASTPPYWHVILAIPDYVCLSTAVDEATCEFLAGVRGWPTA